MIKNYTNNENIFYYPIDELNTGGNIKINTSASTIIEDLNILGDDVTSNIDNTIYGANSCPDKYCTVFNTNCTGNTVEINPTECPSYCPFKSKPCGVVGETITGTTGNEAQLVDGNKHYYALVMFKGDISIENNSYQYIITQDLLKKIANNANNDEKWSSIKMLDYDFGPLFSDDNDDDYELLENIENEDIKFMLKNIYLIINPKSYVESTLINKKEYDDFKNNTNKLLIFESDYDTDRTYSQLYIPGHNSLSSCIIPSKHFLFIMMGGYETVFNTPEDRLSYMKDKIKRNVLETGFTYNYVTIPTNKLIIKRSNDDVFYARYNFTFCYSNVGGGYSTGPKILDYPGVKLHFSNWAGNDNNFPTNYRHNVPIIYNQQTKYTEHNNILIQKTYKITNENITLYTPFKHIYVIPSRPGIDYHNDKYYDFDFTNTSSASPFEDKVINFTTFVSGLTYQYIEGFNGTILTNKVINELFPYKTISNSVLNGPSYANIGYCYKPYAAEAKLKSRGFDMGLSRVNDNTNKYSLYKASEVYPFLSGYNISTIIGSNTNNTVIIDSDVIGWI